MGLKGRLGLILANWAVLIPVAVLSFVAAIYAAKGTKNLNNLTDQNATVERSSKGVKIMTILLWVFGGVIGIGLVLGGWIILPWLTNIPYIFGGVMIMFSLFAAACAGLFFYGALAAKKSTDYQNNTTEAQDAYKSLLTGGILLTVTAVLLTGYSIWGIWYYKKIGGLKGDALYVAEVAPYVAQGFGVPLPVGQAIAGGAKQAIDPTGEVRAKQGGDAALLSSIAGAAGGNPTALLGALGGASGGASTPTTPGAAAPASGGIDVASALKLAQKFIK